MARLRHFGQAVLRYSNWIAAAVVTLCAVYLHALFFLNAGGLWRDEIELVNLSVLPSFSEMWQKLPHDSCPILMHFVVRAWSAAASLGNTDPGLRVLGLYLGLFLLLAFWFASWTMRKGPPLLAVTLAGLSVTIIRAGDSLRGYGLASALAVLTLALIWRLTRHPSLAAFCCAMAVAVLSVQSLYQNAFLLFAACCGAQPILVRFRSEFFHVPGKINCTASNLRPTLQRCSFGWAFSCCRASSLISSR